MKPIQERAEVALDQALRCVQFRLPNAYHLRPSCYCCALGQRYGLIGTAAAFYALEMADLQEEREVRALFHAWPDLVETHFREEIAHRAPFLRNERMIPLLRRCAASPLRVGLALRRQFLPLQRVLELSCEIFARDHRREIAADHWLLLKPRVSRLFRSVADESVHFSLMFFERRRAGLQELSEIALLGE